VKRLWYVYFGVFAIMFKRLLKRAVRYFGEFLKRFGRKLVAIGEDDSPRWDIELFRRCYNEQADAEFHIGSEVYRGPMYAAFSAGNTVSFRMNWLAKKSATGGGWEYGHGTGFLKLKGCGSPYKLGNGDAWFMFEGGYAVLFLGKPKERLEFNGQERTLRTYTYF